MIGLAGPITARVARHAAAALHRVAVIDRGVPVGYGEVWRRVGRCAAWLARRGLAPGDRVGLTLREELPNLVATPALLRLGCIEATLAAHEPLPLRAALAARLGLDALIADGPDDAVDGPSLLLADWPAILAAGEAGDAPVAAGGFVFRSSGTTGRAKLVPMSEAVLAAQSEITCGDGAVRHRGVTNAFPNGKRLQLQTLWHGGTEVLVNNREGRSYASVCAAFGVERLNLSPLQAERVLAETERERAVPWPAGTSIILGGGRAAAPLRAALQARLTRRVLVVFGCTEAGGMAMAGPEDHARHPDGVGLPFPGVALEVVDEAGRVLPPGETGLVRVRGAGCVAGYLDDPGATARAFRDGWFHPGDAGRLADDGSLIHAGRGDDMMDLGTIKIFPAEIEAVAAGFPGLRDLAAFARRSPAFGDVPMLAVVAGPGFDAAALLAQCRSRLGLRAPRGVMEVAALPRNAQGKVLRRVLEEAAGGAAPARRDLARVARGEEALGEEQAG